jgi:hypothetical protein
VAEDLSLPLVGRVGEGVNERDRLMTQRFKFDDPTTDQPLGDIDVAFAVECEAVRAV